MVVNCTVLTLACCALIGCRATLPADLSPGPVPAGNAELTGYIAELPYVTADAGYRAGYTLWKGEPFDGEFDAVRQELRSGKIIGEWEKTPDELLSRAEVGYMVARAIELRRGLNWQLTGLGRYAWRELAYLGIVSASSEYGYVPGGEFLGILGRAGDYRDEHRGSLTRRAVLGEAPG